MAGGRQGNAMKKIAVLTWCTALALICCARSGFAQDFSFNLFYVPNPTCLSGGVAISATESWGLGPFGETCRVNDGSGVAQQDQNFGVVSFFRFGAPLYSDGWSLVNLVSRDSRTLESDAGSTASATIAVIDAFIGYQWVWPQGLNIWLGGGFIYQSPSSVKREFADGESGAARGFIKDNTKTEIVAAPAVTLGWAF